MNNVLAKKSALLTDGLPVLAADQDTLSEHFIPELMVIAHPMAQAVRRAWTAAVPNTFPVLTLPLPFPLDLLEPINLVIGVSRNLSDPNRIVVAVTCPDQPDAILARRHNLLAALAEYYGGDSTVGLPDVKLDGTFVFTLLEEEED